jgi:hypothetical protein
MSGYVQDIEKLAIENDDFRRVLYTAKNSQLVVMSLKPQEDIGAEIHKVDQFFRIEEGTGEAVLNGAGRRSKQALRFSFQRVLTTTSSIPAQFRSNFIRSMLRPIIAMG